MRPPGSEGVGGQGRGRRADVVAGVLGLAVTAGALLTLARVVVLKTSPDLAEGGVVTRTLQVSRGDLLDRRGRPLAMSGVGFRVIVDPERLPDPPDAVVLALASALDAPADAIGERIMTCLAKNDGRRPETAPDEAPPTLDALRQAWSRRFGSSTVPAEAESDTPPEAGPARYLPIGGIIDEPTATMVRALALPGVWIEGRPVRRYPGGDEVASIVGKAGLADRSLDEAGLLGAELALNDRLAESDGHAVYVRDAWRRPLWLERGDWSPGAPGDDVRLSVDLELQRIAHEELVAGVERADAAGGRLVLMNPDSGEVLAMTDVIREIPDAVPYPWLVRNETTNEWTAPLGDLPPDPRDRPRYRVTHADPGRAVHPALGRNRCVEDAYEPGSTFKPFVWSVAWERGLIGPDETLHHEKNWYITQSGRGVKDVTFRNTLSWDDVLKFSSNIGMAKISERLEPADLRGTLDRFGFGRVTGIGLPGESTGLVTSEENWTTYSQTYVSIGHEIGVTPVQMVRAFSAFAREGQGGLLAGSLPRPTMLAGEGDAAEVGYIERVLPPEVARRARFAMVGVAERLDALIAGTMPELPEPSYTMFGKSGTAQIPCVPPPEHGRPKGSSGYFQNQYNSSFVAAGPVSDPELVIVVVIDDPGPARVRIRQHYGSWVAGPVARRVMDRALTYMGVEPDMPTDPAQTAAAD